MMGKIPSIGVVFARQRGVCPLVALGDRPLVQLARPGITPFIPQQRLLKPARPGRKIQNLRLGLRKQRQLVWIFNLPALPNALTIGPDGGPPVLLTRT